MTNQILFFTGIIFFGLLGNASLTPTQMLQEADRARGGLSHGLTWKLKLISKDGTQDTQFEYDVKVKETHVLAKCTEPARSKDEVYLFSDHSLWMYRPGLRKPLSLSPRQRLSGQTANGDIATTNYARDYLPTLTGEETVDGKKTWKLKLKARSDDLTYDQINYWISQDQVLGIKVEFLTSEGQLFKSARISYGNTIQVSGKTLPFISKMTISDAKNPQLVSDLIYGKPISKDFSDSEFNVNNLIK